MTDPLHAGLKRSKFLSACGGESILVHLNPNALPGGLIYQLSTLCSEGVTAAPWLGLGGKKVNPWCYQRHPNSWSCLYTVAHTWILPWILLGIWRVVGYIMSWNKSLYQLLSPKALRVLMWPSKAFFDHSTGLGTAQYILVWQGERLCKPMRVRAGQRALGCSGQLCPFLSLIGNPFSYAVEIRGRIR